MTRSSRRCDSKQAGHHARIGRSQCCVEKTPCQVIVVNQRKSVRNVSDSNA
jgi:hypothetical protein